MSTNGAASPSKSDYLIQDFNAAVDDFLSYRDRIAETPGITWGVDAIDKRVIPFHPGDLVSLIGRPGSGKTTLMQMLAKREADAIRKRGAYERECVVYVSWEQSREEIAMLMLADEHMPVSDIAWGNVGRDRILQTLPRRGHKLSMFLVGHSLNRPDPSRERMTLDRVLEAIRFVERDHGVRPTLCCLDYVQIIPVNHARERVQQVSEAAVKCKELALQTSCPVVIGVQASRRVDDYGANVPKMSDAQWASGIEQNSDKIFGLWRPVTTHTSKDDISVGSAEYPVSDKLLVMRILKQRLEASGWTWALYFDPAKMILQEMEASWRAER